jgi:hypothetical protein
MNMIRVALGASGFSAIVVAAGNLQMSSLAANSEVKTGAATAANQSKRKPVFRTRKQPLDILPVF